jgi:hypothetical protein
MASLRDAPMAGFTIAKQAEIQCALTFAINEAFASRNNLD